MAIFKRKTGGTKVGNLLRSVASNIISKTNIGRAINATAPIRSQTTPKASVPVISGPQSRPVKIAGPQSLAKISGPQSLNIRNGGMSVGTSYNPSVSTVKSIQSLPKKVSSMPSGGGSARVLSGGSTRTPSGGSSISSSRVSSPVVQSQARTSSTGSMFSGIGTGSAIAPKVGGNINAPIGGAVIGSTEFNYNLTPQQIAEKEARERLTEFKDQEASQDVNEDNIYRDTLRRFQGEIDATNEIMAEKLRQARLAGQSRLGSTRAENFNAGAVDSSFGNAAMQRVVADNASMENAILAEKVQAIAQIENQARELGNAYFQQRKQAKESGLTDYLEAIKGAGAAKEAIASDIADSILASDISIEEIEPKRLSEIAKNAGVTVNQIKKAWSDTQMALAESFKKEGVTLGKDQIRIEFNPETGQYEQVAGGTATGTGMADASIIDAWAKGIKAGTYKPSDVPDELADAVAMALQEGADVPSDQVAISMDLALNAVEQAKELAHVSGSSKLNVWLRDLSKGSNKFRQLENLADTLRTNLLTIGSDPNIRKFFGPQMSEADVRMMMAGGSILDPRRQEPEQFLEELERAEAIFAKIKSGASQTQQQAPSELDEDELEYLRMQGFTDEEIQSSFSQASSIGSVDEALEKIGAVESGGNYQALGPVLNSGQYKGQRAIGKYQVMEGNIPSWSKMALGYSVTPQEFYNNPRIQDAVARDQFQRNFEKYGNWDDAASVWFTGRPLARAGNARDQLGTSVQEYVKRFNMA